MPDPVYILIRTSNRPKYFSVMMESVKAQDYPNIITIVHTDNDRDEYIEGDIIIRSHRIPENGRGHYNLYCNTLLQAIPDGPGWYHFLDDDDMYSTPDVISRLVKESKRDHINVGRVRRWNSTVWPKHWGTQKSYQTECFFLHTDHKNLARWWNKTGGDHYYSKQITAVLPINWIDNLLIAQAQTGKGRGQRLDLDQLKLSRTRVSRVGARHAGPPVKVQFIRRVSGRASQRGRKGDIKQIPLNYALRLERIGRVEILENQNK